MGLTTKFAQLRQALRPESPREPAAPARQAKTVQTTGAAADRADAGKRRDSKDRSARYELNRSPRLKSPPGRFNKAAPVQASWGSIADARVASERPHSVVERVTSAPFDVEKFLAESPASQASTDPRDAAKLRDTTSFSDVAQQVPEEKIVDSAYAAQVRQKRQ
jgi:hypothetical protein